MAEFRYATYPDAKVYDDDEKEINHLLFGDWVRIEGPVQQGWVPVYVRGTPGWMHEDDLQVERVLEVVFTDVGQGDGCLLVTPSDKHIIIDAGASDNMVRFLRWRYAGFKKKWTFQSVILTHPDLDHYEGFRKLFEEPNVHVESIFHNGIMEQRADSASKELGPTKKIDGQPFLTGLIRTKADLKAFLAETDRWKTERASKKYASLLDKALATDRVGDVRMLATDADGPPTYLPDYGPDDDIEIRVLAPVVERDDAGNRMLRAFGDDPRSRSLDVGKTKNGHSVILMLRCGDVRLLFGGDLNTSSQAFLLKHYSGLNYDWPWSANEEDEIVAAAATTFAADITKSCHHGAADIADAFLRAVRPAATIISSGDDESHAHPRPDALGAVGLHSRGWRPLLFSTELMRSTREDEGTIPVEIGRIRQKLEDETDPDKRAELQKAHDALVDRLFERNVTVYGSINLRTDGTNTIIAYKLERERKQGKRLTKWDIYPLTRSGNGPISYAPKDH